MERETKVDNTVEAESMSVKICKIMQRCERKYGPNYESKALRMINRLVFGQRRPRKSEAMNQIISKTDAGTKVFQKCGIDI